MIFYFRMENFQRLQKISICEIALPSSLMAKGTISPLDRLMPIPLWQQNLSPQGSLNATAEVRMRDIIDPHEFAMYRALAGGLKSINLPHAFTTQ
jgi:hypothetical protein